MSKNEWKRDEFIITTNRSDLQIEEILDYLQKDSYWAKDRTFEQMEKIVTNSFCFGLYRNEQQIGFARVVTDYATFAYLGDVYVLSEFRGNGLGMWLMDVVISHPDLQGFRRWVLATRDAHKLYEKFKFTELKHPERWMEKAAPDAY